MNWDDLRFFLALYRDGGVRGAAAQLRVSHSTVTRRIQVLEERLATHLFDRTPDGFALTSSGQSILPIAEAIEDQAANLERGALGRDERLAGDIRLTVPNPVLHSPVMGDIARFTQLYPDIDLDIVQSYDFVDMSRREADVAIRFEQLGRSPPEHLIGRRLLVSSHAIYVAKNGLNDPEKPYILGWVEGVRNPSWVADLPVPKLPARHKINDPIGQAEACARGMGYAILATMQGDPHPHLKRLDGVPAWPSRDVWMLTHPDLRATERLRIFRNYLADSILNHRDLFEGTGASL